MTRSRAAAAGPSLGPRFALFGGSLAAMVACANAGGPRFPTSDSFPSGAREPPQLAPPASMTAVKSGENEPARASDDADPGSPRPRAADIMPLTRREPMDPEAAQALVLAFFSAMVRESREELLLLFSPQAFVVSESSRQLASPFWSARLAQLDYRVLRGELLLDRTSLRLYTEEAGERARADGVPAPRAGEAVVVVNPGFIWSGRPRLLGDSLSFRVRPRKADARFEITEVTEDFRLP